MDELSILARGIVRTIEEEDFLYALKHYGSYKMNILAKDIQRVLIDNEE